MPAALTALVVALLQFAPATTPATTPASAPTTAPATRPTLEALKAAFFQDAVDLPDAPADVPVKPIAAYIKFDIVDGFLNLIPQIDDTEAKTAVRLAGLPGRAAISVSREQTVIALHYVSTERADEVGSITSVITAPDYLQIARDTELPGEGSRSVSLVQQPLAVGEDPVRLFVTQSNPDSEEAAVKLKLTASSFRQLQIKYPIETRQYLVPLLRDLGATAVLEYASRAMAWQAIGSDAAEDVTETQIISDLVKRLDAAEFSERELAAAGLQKLGPPAATRLARRGTRDLAPEPKAAVEAFIASQRPLADVDAQRLTRDADFLLDVLALNEPRLNPVVVGRLKAVGGPVFDLAALDASTDRPAAVEALRRALPRPATDSPTAPATGPTTN